MAQKRTRDKVWMHALALARAGQPVTPEAIVEATGASERTARETLNVMAETAFLDRDQMTDGTVRFLAGEGIQQ